MGKLPQNKLTPAQAKQLEHIKKTNRVDATMDSQDGRDTRMSRDGGTGRRLRR